MSEETTRTNALTEQPLGDTEKYDVFISYRRRDEHYALLLKKSLEEQGLGVFFDHVSIKNEAFPEKIRHAIERSKNFILVMTKGVFVHEQEGEAPNQGKDWVHEELRIALEHDVNYIFVQPKEEPPDYEGLPDDLRRKIEFVNTRRLGTGQFFEPSLTNILGDLKNVQLRDEKKSNEVAYKNTVLRLLENDCKIDSSERSQLDQTGEDLNISPEEQVKYESDVQTMYLRGLKESNEKLKGENDKLKTDLRALTLEKKNLEEKNNDLDLANKRLTPLEKSLMLWKVCSIFQGVICAVCLVGWLWTGLKEKDGLSNEIQLDWRVERERLEKDIAKARQDAEQEKTNAEAIKRDTDKTMTVAQKQVAAASLAREQAERDAKEVKAKLAAAQESVASSDAARKDAENRLAQVSAALETEQAEHAKDKKTIESQQKDILDMRVSEQAARKDAELKSVEKAAELERANEKIKELEAEKSRLEKELEQARERKRIEDDLNVL